MARHYVLQGFAQVAQQVESIGDLHGPWRTFTDRFGVGSGTITADHFGWSMITQPLGDGVGLAVGQ